MATKLAAGASALLLLAGCSGGAGNDVDAHGGATKPGSATIAAPASIGEEHHELHEVLAAATMEPGALGAAAGKLEAVLGPHFAREEQIATPPLGLLGPLAHGPATEEMRDVLPMTDALEAELPKMMEEHGAIKAATAELRAAAVAARRDDLVRFADHLAAHALQEEEILYPAAILVGRDVKATAPKK
jgi:hypothetical protein